jgi:hypothetical protein
MHKQILPNKNSAAPDFRASFRVFRCTLYAHHHDTAANNMFDFAILQIYD